MTGTHRPILVVGLPRSGTTWTESILGTAIGAAIISEPDNEKLSAPAIRAKRVLGRYPVLAPGDAAPAYEQLWRWALTGAPTSRTLEAAARLVRRASAEDAESLVNHRPSFELRLAGILGSCPRTAKGSDLVVAKSVHAGLAIDWIDDKFDLDVLVILRNPANVLSSWLELDLPDRDRDLGSSRLVRKRYMDAWDVPPPSGGIVQRAAWQLGLLMTALERSAKAHPRWLVRTHERLCSDPETEFRLLFEELGLIWGPTSLGTLERSDVPGTGFSLNRKASQLADSWRGRLDSETLELLGRVLCQFPLKTWDPMDLSAAPNGSADWLSPRSPPYPKGSTGGDGR